MPNEVEVKWPSKLGIIFRRGLLSEKEQRTIPDLAPGELVAYGLDFSKEQILWTKTEISPKDKPQDLVVLKHTYKCPTHGLYYFPKVVVRPLEGKTLPKGIIRVHADGQLVMEGWIADFLPDQKPVDCLKLSQWKEAKDIFPAYTLNNTGAADPNRQVGYMLTNLSKVEVTLSDVMAEEMMTLEIGLLTAYYSTRKSEVKV
jgi:hypothetical protein